MQLPLNPKGKSLKHSVWFLEISREFWEAIVINYVGSYTKLTTYTNQLKVGDVGLEQWYSR